jgi:hypothetical protein
MQDDEISIAPTTGILASYFDSNLRHKPALSELIDNSLDAAATLIRVAFSQKRFSVQDDGNGCADPAVMVRQGDRIQHGGRTLGRYGVGAKEAILWIGGESSRLTVVTTHGGVRRTLRVDWSEMLKAREWIIKRPASEADESGRGTSVTIDRPGRRPPHGADWSELLVDLGYMYSPALKLGRQIVLTGPDGQSRPLVRFELPEMTDRVETTIDVGGRKAKVFAGIVPTGVVNPRPGITYVHGLRVIKPASGHGCDGLDYGRVCGIVNLTDGWVLTKNKDDVSRHSDELYAAVFSVLEGLLRKAETLSHMLESAQFLTSVEGALNSMIRPDAKAVRGPGDKSGTVKPTGKGHRHRRAKEEQEGRTFVGRTKSGALRLSIVEWANEKVGGFSPPNTVQLNRNHGGIAHLLRTQNRDAVVWGALGLLCAAETLSDGRQTVLRPMRDDVADPAERFNHMFGELTSRPLILDGRDLSPPGMAPLAASRGGEAE